MLEGGVDLQDYVRLRWQVQLGTHEGSVGVQRRANDAGQRPEEDHHGPAPVEVVPRRGMVGEAARSVGVRLRQRDP